LFAARIHPDDLGRLGDAWTGTTERGVPFDIAYRVVRSDSEQRHVHARTEAELDESGRVISVVGTLTDNTGVSTPSAFATPPKPASRSASNKRGSEPESSISTAPRFG
jgi:hypothetical protein